MLFYEGKKRQKGRHNKLAKRLCVCRLLQADQKHFSKQNKATTKNTKTCDWLVVSTRLKNISQIGSFPSRGENKQIFETTK